MPFYEYRCKHCQHTEALLESMNAPQEKTCPQCGKRRAFKRLISAAGFQLKGEGWYVTDFKNKDKPADKKPSADKSDEKKTAAAESKSSDSDKKSGDSDKKASGGDAKSDGSDKKTASRAKS